MTLRRLSHLSFDHLFEKPASRQRMLGAAHVFGSERHGGRVRVRAGQIFLLSGLTVGVVLPLKAAL